METSWSISISAISLDNTRSTDFFIYTECLKYQLRSWLESYLEYVLQSHFLTCSWLYLNIQINSMLPWKWKSPTMWNTNRITSSLPQMIKSWNCINRPCFRSCTNNRMQSRVTEMSAYTIAETSPTTDEASLNILKRP